MKTIRSSSTFITRSLGIFITFASILLPVTPAVVQLGNEKLRENQYILLQNERVAVLSNPTGVYDDTLVHIVDDMHEVANLTLLAIFSPEHGFRGEKQAETGDPPVYIDEVTGLPVFSAYSLSIENITHVFEEHKITALVVDIQDVGVRLYTYIWTMFKMMQAVARVGNNPVRFIVADRPNPLGGLLVSGPLLNITCCASGYGRAPIPHIHGMTIGELALFFNAGGLIKPAIAHLEVLPLTGWTREMTWEHTGLSWVPPSPNIPTAKSVIAYAASVFLEATTISEGRGTTIPFQIFGAPFLDAQAMSIKLNEAFDVKNSTELYFRAAYYEPTFSKYNNSICNGVHWVRGKSDFLASLNILIVSKSLSQNESFHWDGSWFGHPGTELIDEYMGTYRVREMIDDGWTAERIDNYYAEDADNFVTTRAPYLLYDAP